MMSTPSAAASMPRSRAAAAVESSQRGDVDRRPGLQAGRRGHRSAARALGVWRSASAVRWPAVPFDTAVTARRAIGVWRLTFAVCWTRCSIRHRRCGISHSRGTTTSNAERITPNGAGEAGASAIAPSAASAYRPRVTSATPIAPRADPAAPPARRTLRIVLPAYNEADNLPALLRGLQQAMEDSGFSYEIILVDDGSRDRTGA